MKFWRKPLDSDDIKVTKGDIHIFTERCKGCGFCVQYCPKEVLELSEEFNKMGYHPPYVKHEENCLFCKLCEMLCPDFSIFVTEKKGRVTSKKA